MKLLGLIGYPLSHSFSKRYFTEKFERENIHNFRYELFPLKRIEEFPALWETQLELHGLNVTIPYKQAVLPYLNRVDESAAFGAVNTIRRDTDGLLVGFNTDTYGFEQSLRPHLKPSHYQSMALILGTGGAAKAVAHVLSKLGIDYSFVSRRPEAGQLDYHQLDKAWIERSLLIINTTPLGMHPVVDDCPTIPYVYTTSEHIFYDLVYNPATTLFLQKGAERGATVINGLQMLHLQAEKAWEIWNSEQ